MNEFNLSDNRWSTLVGARNYLYNNNLYPAILNIDVDAYVDTNPTVFEVDSWLTIRGTGQGAIKIWDSVNEELTINGPLEGPAVQIFKFMGSGAGSVYVKNTEAVVPQWFTFDTGQTDDKIIHKALIAATGTDNKIPVFIPPGDYSIGAAIEFAGQPVTIRGAGMKATVLRLSDDNSDGIFEINNSVSEVTGVHLSHLGFTRTDDEIGIPLKVINVNEVTVENCGFFTAKYGMQMSGCHNVIVSDNSFEDLTDYGIEKLDLGIRNWGLTKVLSS